VSSASTGYFVTDAQVATWTPPPELVKGLLSSGEVNMLFAPKNRGKTFLGLGLAYSIVTEQPTFMGCPIRKFGSVVYLCAEGRGGLVKRRAAWRQRHPKAELGHGLGFPKDLVDIRDDEAVGRLIEQIRCTYPDTVLVVVDTLSQHMPGGDEGTSDMSAALHGCQRIRDEVGTTVLAIHHPTKADEKNARGGSGFRGGCADVLNVEESDGAFWIKTQNARDRAKDGDAIPYVLDVVTLDGYRDEDGQPLTSCVARYLDTPQSRQQEQGRADELDGLIVRSLSENGPSKACDIAKAVKKRNGDVGKALHRLKGISVAQDDQKRWTLLQ